MGKIINIGTVISSLFASACCVLPVFLAGVSGIAAIASFFEKLRPFFILIAVIFLSYGFYVAYFQKEKECVPGEICATPFGKYKQRIILWVITVFVVFAITLPYWIQLL